MTGALIILAVTLLTGLILYLTRGKDVTPVGTGHAPSAGDEAYTPGDKITDKNSAKTGDKADSSEVCCGRHAVCEKGLLRPDELYYADEELDRFAGRDPQDYTTDEIEEFREVLYTLRPDEVYPWGVALTQRDIALPLDLRDEWVMLTS